MSQPWWLDSDILEDLVWLGLVTLAAPFFAWQKNVICPSCRRDRQWLWRARGATQTHFFCPYCDDPIDERWKP